MDYRYLWAKKKRIDGDYYWLPLYIHLEDTAYIAGLLWEHWLSDGVKEDIYENISKTSPIDEDYPKNLAMFLGYTHDLGKCSANFEFKKTFPIDPDLDLAIFDKLKSGGFDFVNYYRVKNFRHNLVSEYILNEKGLDPSVSVILGAHHGKPISRVAFQALEEHKYEIYQSDDKTSLLYKNWDNLHEYFIKNALDISGLEDVSKIVTLPESAQVIFSGLLILADWIASNEKYFPLIPIDDLCGSKNRVEEGFISWQNDKANPWDPKPSDTSKMFEERFNFKPRKDQETLTNLVKKIKEPGILIYEATTGSGKTEAALIAAEIMSDKSHRSGLFFALPSQATSNGIFSRMKDWLNKLSSLEKGNMGLRLIHGKASLNNEFTSIKPSSNIYEEEEYGVSVNSYFAGNKLSILDDFTVGTIDQLLLMALKQKHLMLRHLGFSNKVVIIDEAHAYSTYMNIYLDQALKWLGAYKVPVIILSATLPLKRRNELIKAYLIGQNKKSKDIEEPMDFETEKSYPLVSFTDGNKIIQFKDFEKTSSRRFEIIKLDKNDSENIAERIIKDSKNGGVFGIIVNTVKKCQSVAKQLIEIFGEDKVEILHSSFISTERTEKENNLLRIIGKNGKRPDFKIIIGTQVIEQSLDIDFDVLYTELAPIDLLIQRMGRLHRHRETKRPKNFLNPKVYVMDSVSYDFDEGSTYVYKQYVLMRTEFYLPNEIFIPKDVSDLVQKVYSDEDIEIEETYREAYEEYKNKYQSYKENKGEQAKTFALANPKYKVRPDKNISKWLENSNNIAELSETKGACEVRDSEDSIELICLQEKNGGYGYFGDNNALGELDNNLAKEIAKHTIKLPAGMSYGENLDKYIEILENYYIKYLRNWDKYTWLKGNLAIIFDKNGDFDLGDYNLHYDEKLGLSYERKE